MIHFGTPDDVTNDLDVTRRLDLRILKKVLNMKNI